MHREGKPPWPQEASPPLSRHDGHKVQPKQTSDTCSSDAGDFESASAHWAYPALGPKPNPSLYFQSSILTLLTHKP